MLKRCFKYFLCLTASLEVALPSPPRCQRGLHKINAPAWLNRHRKIYALPHATVKIVVWQTFILKRNSKGYGVVPLK